MVRSPPSSPRATSPRPVAAPPAGRPDRRRRSAGSARSTTPPAARWPIRAGPARPPDPAGSPARAPRTGSTAASPSWTRRRRWGRPAPAHAGPNDRAPGPPASRARPPPGRWPPALRRPTRPGPGRRPPRRAAGVDDRSRRRRRVRPAAPRRCVVGGSRSPKSSATPCLVPKQATKSARRVLRRTVDPRHPIERGSIHRTAHSPEGLLAGSSSHRAREKRLLPAVMRP